MSDHADIIQTMSERLNIYRNFGFEYNMKQKLRDLKLIRDNINTKIRNRDTMLRDIMLSEPDGLSTAELKSKLGCHRDTIHGIGIELINEGLITKHGKFGRYHLTRASLEDPEIIASFFGAKIMRNFYSLGQEPICIKNIFCNQNLCKTALTVDEKKLKRRLLDKSNFFEFALRLGAILTYQIMQSMRYCQLHDLSSDHVYKTSSKSRDEKMLKYIQNMINPSSLIFAFRDLHSLHSRLKPHRLIEVIADERDAKIYERQLKTHPSILEFGKESSRSWKGYIKRHFLNCLQT